MTDNKTNQVEKTPLLHEGVTRRSFLTTAGLGSVGVAAVGGLAATAPVEAVQDAQVASASEAIPVTLKINGRTVRLLVEPRWSVGFVLHEKLGLTGTKLGCERGECGACTVLIDGKPRYSCLTLCLEAQGSEIITIEGLMKGEELGEVQKAFAEEDAFQCGYCTSGQIMAVEGLLRANPGPTLDEVRQGVSGNLCRCGTYRNIFAAARRAAEARQGGGAR